MLELPGTLSVPDVAVKSVSRAIQDSGAGAPLSSPSGGIMVATPHGVSAQSLSFSCRLRLGVPRAALNAVDLDASTGVRVPISRPA